MITLALSKGRIFDETLPFLQAMGVEPAEHPDASRKLILATNSPSLRLLVVRASDVPTYVRYGAADAGIAGSDVLDETDGEQLYQPVDLGIGRCRMSVAAPVGANIEGRIQQGARLRVATKYTNAARAHFLQKGVHLDLIKLYGSMELAPLVGLADAIVDLVSTGGTLKANGLEEIEVIREISSRLVINPAALKTRHDELQPLIAAFASTAAQQRSR